MSCYILRAESFEALAVSLAALEVRVPDIDRYAAIAWRASAANAAAYAYRYREALDAHPLEVKHGTPEAFAGRVRLWRSGTRGSPAVRSEVALVKLLECLAYQIADAPEGSEAGDVGHELHTLAAELALVLLRRTADYEAAPWGDSADEPERGAHVWLHFGTPPGPLVTTRAPMRDGRVLWAGRWHDVVGGVATIDGERVRVQTEEVGR